MTIQEKYQDYESRNRVYLYADKETALKLNINVGEKYSIFPEPKNVKEAFERLENYNGLIVLESIINNFKKKFPINHRTINDRLQLINDFIVDAEKVNINDALNITIADKIKIKQIEFLKIKYDYYKNENLDYTNFYDFFSGETISVYAEFFLFKEWLENQLIDANNIDDSEKIKVVFIEKIKEAEKLAESTIQFSLKQDFFDIESKKFNKETHEELIKNFYLNTVNSYLNIHNLYKVSNEQFHFINNEVDEKMGDDDRIDFIATVLTGYLIDSSIDSNSFDDVELEEILKQLQNIDEIVYETKLAELKFNTIKRMVEKIEEKESNPEKVYPILDNSWKISLELLEGFRLQYSTSKLIFNCKEDEIEIVPKIQTHDYLKRNFSIDEFILNYYYSPCRQFISDDDFNKMKASGYIGDIETTLAPYPIQIFGAYHFRIKLHSQLSFLISEKNYYCNKKNVIFLSDLAPYFIDYSEGFKNGFLNFESECITPFLNDYSDKSDYTFKVFEYISKRIDFHHNWSYSLGSFTVSPNQQGENHIINAFEDGQFQGYFYKAWSMILSNSKIYEHYFKENLLETPTLSTSKIQNISSKEIKPKKIAEKWYALLYWIQLISKCEQPPKTIEGEFIKSEIMTIGSKMTKTTGQSFYKKFIEIADYLNDEKMIEKMYSLDWKNKIIELSKNDADIITYFQVKPK